MAKVYRVSGTTRLINAPFKVMTRLGIGARYRHILRVRGRTTGKTYSTPVDVMSDDGHRWLVAPYGEVGWVRNARVAGEVTLARGGRSERVAIYELGPAESTPVLRRYIEAVPITRPYFDVTAESPDAAFAAEAPRHPVFRIARA